MIFFCALVSGAQEVKALTVGDRVPDIKIENVYNSSSSSIHLADLQGKLVVIDFMATTCVPCVRALPRLDTLQKKYSNRLQVFLISPEEAGRIKTFLNNHHSLELPIAADTNAA